MYCFDAHIDTALRLWKEEHDLALLEGHVNLEKLERGGISAQVFAIFVPPEFRPMALGVALEMVESVVATTRQYPKKLSLIETKTDLERAKEEGQIGVLLSLEGGEPLEESLRHLRTFFRLGVRALTLTWNHRNLLADGVGQTSNPSGLTNFGEKVIEAMNTWGMVVDVSHIAEPGFWHALKVSKHPVIASHSNAKALCPNRRNLTDLEIRAIADKGGVIGVNFCPDFLDPTGRASLETVISMLLYLRKVGGTEAVGLGSDFDGISTTPLGLEDVGTLGKIIQGLKARRIPESHMEKMLGLNFYRVFHEVLPSSV